ncbi:FGGY-family carbohydrate kinase [Pelomonas sp. V22]|uniref:FGGY-family carbohydrate kinase n=1 Tax=Pelomonas sp. V22 TaxID=2822139 RepID=UPI0024A7F282|nr:FGGY-family carbohydrate kinase [Pelomonas sp. V22]MDI4635436.1 FGGY-family carbohydrate kinase [Pelomonas sp. V22]
MSSQEAACVVLDIGKTNSKLSLLGQDGRVLEERRRPNVVLQGGPYPHLDVEGLWPWMLQTLRELAATARITAIVPVTHGATAALIDEQGLTLPVLDYEFTPPEDRYRSQRPAFAETQSPKLPAGLNLGRQLAWLAEAFPAEFARTRQVLMYPQYWAWRFCGVAASELTSLGCHTDLWSPQARHFSSLVEAKGWQDKFPPLQSAWATLGPLLPEIAAVTGLGPDCRVICGIHDSNASLLRYLQASEPITVLSTGTWVIAAALGGQAPLDERQDMLANVDVHGRPVPCMRFMGGREFGALAGGEPAAFSVADLQTLVHRQTLALPCFAEAGGPFAGQAGRIEGPAPETPAERTALATLYSALMTDYCLTSLNARGPVIVEGSFSRNALFGPLLAALRPGQAVCVSDDSSGTTCGGWMLQHWGTQPPASHQPAVALPLPGLTSYRQQWHEKLPMS